MAFLSDILLETTNNHAHKMECVAASGTEGQRQEGKGSMGGMEVGDDGMKFVKSR